LKACLVSDLDVLSILCTAKFRNLASSRPRGSQVFDCRGKGANYQVRAASPEFSAEIDTQQFMMGADFSAVVHHQPHKAKGGGRFALEIYPTDHFFKAADEQSLLNYRLPVPDVEAIAFATSLAYDPVNDLLAVGANGQNFASRIFIYHGFSTGQLRLANTTDTPLAQGLRPSGLAFLDGHLWVASYTGNCVCILPAPFQGASISREISGFKSPLALFASAEGMYVTTHLGHELLLCDGGDSIAVKQVCAAGSGLKYPWGVTGHETGSGTELLVASLNLDDQARSYVSLCTRSIDGCTALERVSISGALDLFGISVIRQDFCC
jgi:hypothetical protein